MFKYLIRWQGALTQLVLQVTELVVFNMFVLAEEVLVDVSPSKQPHVWVVRDGTICVVGAVECCTLSLGLHRRHNERHAKQPQQLLASKISHYSHKNKHTKTQYRFDLHTSRWYWFLDDTDAICQDFKYVLHCDLLVRACFCSHLRNTVALSSIYKTAKGINKDQFYITWWFYEGWNADSLWHLMVWVSWHMHTLTHKFAAKIVR